MLWLALTLSLVGLPGTATADSFAPTVSSEASSSQVAPSTVYSVAAAADNGGKQVIKVACFVPLEIPFGQAIYKAVRLAEAQVNGNDQLLPDYTIQVVPVNTSLSTTQATAAVVQTMLAERVVAAVGPMTSSQAHVLSAIHTQVQVPMVSYSATDPSLSAASYPFFTRTIRSDALEMQAIADLVTHFSWLEVIAIYSDDDYGRNGVNQLAVLLDKASVDVVKSIAVPLDASLSDIIVRLLAAQKLESTVFILQLNLALIVPVLTAASEVGMMTPGYVWIATEGVTSELENLPELSTEGMIGTRVLVPPNPQLSEFERAWQADGDGNMINGGAAFDQVRNEGRRRGGRGGGCLRRLKSCLSLSARGRRMGWGQMQPTVVRPLIR
ncbi:unnamed protein product [Closterium sp. NIES-54]